MTHIRMAKSMLPASVGRHMRRAVIGVAMLMMAGAGDAGSASELLSRLYAASINEELERREAGA